MTSKNPIIKPLFTDDEIQARISDLADQLNQDYMDTEVTAICTLKGSFIFYCDLIRHLKFPLNCEFLGVSSYGNDTKTSGEVKLTLDITTPLLNRHVLLIEDIVDTGLTLNFLQRMIYQRQPASLRVCSLLVKPESIQTDVKIDYFGFEIGSEFVVGYGVDYAERYRELPYIGVLEQELES